jgi:hypothetical protein
MTMPHRPDWSRTRLPLDEPTLLASVQLIRVCHHIAPCGKDSRAVGSLHRRATRWDQEPDGRSVSPWVGTRELLLRRRNP